MNKYPRTEARLRHLVRERDRLEQDFATSQSLTVRSSLEDVTEEIYELQFLLAVAAVHRWMQIVLPLIIVIAMLYGLIQWLI